MYQLTVNGGWWAYIAPLRKREAFRTYGSLRGKPSHGAETTGMLPASFHISASRADYVVYSYETPIAWHLPADVHEAPAGAKVYADGWIVPDMRYSVTTTKQSGRVITALSVLWDAAYDRYVTDAPPRPRPRTRPATRHRSARTPAVSSARASYDAIEAEFGESWADASRSPQFIP